MQFIEKLDYTSDKITMLMEANTILGSINLAPENQISLKSKIGSENKWKSGVGSFYDFNSQSFNDAEVNYTEWNLPEDNFIRKEIIELEKKFNFISGRIRIMSLAPKQGLTVHQDQEIRYHYVLETNPYSYFCHNIAKFENIATPVGVFYHIPDDGHWYKVDTTKTHWIFNGGKTRRVHIVVCAAHDG